MATSPIKFKVFEALSREPHPAKALRIPQWYWHMILGNGEVVAPSEGYDEPRSAHDTIESVWLAVARVFGGYDGTAADRANLLEAYPVPYTKDSLRRPPPKAKSADLHKRASAAIEKVTATIEKTKPATATSKPPRLATPAEMKKFAAVKKAAASRRK